MKHLLLTSLFLIVFSSLYAIDCTKYIDETIKPLDFRGTVLSKKVDVKAKIYSIQIKTETNGVITLKLIINKSSTELFNFAMEQSMIKKSKNSLKISIANRIVKTGSINVSQFDISCE